MRWSRDCLTGGPWLEYVRRLSRGKGVPIAMTRSRLAEVNPERLVVIKPSALGDVVNAFHALSALRARWPRAKISWVINRSLRGLVDGHPQIDEVIEYDRSHAGLRAFARF